MAHNDRCVICDYSEHEGAPALGILPRGNGKVRLQGTEMRCDVCHSTVGRTIYELSLQDDNNEPVGAAAHPVSVRDK